MLGGTDRSFPKYKRFLWLYKRIFANIDEVYAQGEMDEERLRLLGAKNIKVIGNMGMSDIPKASKDLKNKVLLILLGGKGYPTEGGKRKGRIGLFRKGFFLSKRLKRKEGKGTGQKFIKVWFPEEHSPGTGFRNFNGRWETL